METALLKSGHLDHSYGSNFAQISLPFKKVRFICEHFRLISIEFCYIFAIIFSSAFLLDWSCGGVGFEIKSFCSSFFFSLDTYKSLNFVFKFICLDILENPFAFVNCPSICFNLSFINFSFLFFFNFLFVIPN